MTISPKIHLDHAAILIESAGQHRRVTIFKSPFTLGRSEDCDVPIADARVSRVHARIEIENGAYFIMDAGSRHGTFVNGEHCTRAALKNKDEIRLGESVRIVFLLGETSTSSPNVLLTQLANTDSSDLEKLRLFLEAARSLSTGVVEDVLPNMLDYALKITGAERGFVYLKDKSGRPALTYGMDNARAPINQDADVSHSVVHEAMVSAAEFITGDAKSDRAFSERQSILLNDLRTVIAIPLRTRHIASPSATAEVEVDGVLYLDSRSISHRLSGVSHEVLRALASECAAVLESAKLVAAEQAATQYRKEMEIASSIQRSLIGASDTQSDFALITGHSVPCREVGGDFFDVYISPEAVTVIVADVSGKGISAALLASLIHGMFYSQISTGTSLVNAISSINRFLCSRVAGQKYATLLAAQLENSGTLKMVNCGHVPVLIAQDGKVSHIMEGNSPVGLIPDAKFYMIERHFPVGSRLCILTDGISETENTKGEEFGTRKIEECLFDAHPVARVMDCLHSFSGGLEAEDDRTMVLLERIR